MYFNFESFRGSEFPPLSSIDPPMDNDIIQNNMMEGKVEHTLLHPPSNGDNMACNEESSKDLNINKKAITSISSRGKTRFEGDTPTTLVSEGAESPNLISKVSKGAESPTLSSIYPPMDNDVIQNNTIEDKTQHTLLHPPSNRHYSEGDSVTYNEEYPKDLNTNKEATTSISTRGRMRFASKKLLENTENKKFKTTLGFICTISAYVLNASHFVYYEYKRINYERIYSFHSKRLHHHEIVNMNTDSTCNYIHPLSYTTSK